jgi:uncharacterized cofD-like protein
MQAMPSRGFVNELPSTTFWQSDPSRTPIEHLLDYLLTGSLAQNSPPGIRNMAERALRFDIRNTRAVILGGGTGLSTVVGGNSQMPDWPEQPCIGLKQEFPHLTFIVCTTDDGGSTGRLLKSLPLIGVGDLRKLLISSIHLETLQQTYGLGEARALDLIRLIHCLFNYRFDENKSNFSCVANPLLAAPGDLRVGCPKTLAESLKKLGAHISPGGSGPAITPSGHSLGNLLLTSAIFMAAGDRTDRPPAQQEIQRGIDHIAGLIGSPRRKIHAATCAPGQLKLRYANGVEVRGQSKAAQARRTSPVDRVFVEFARKPAVSAAVQNAIRNADLILCAPGSLYTSIIPILQLDPIVAAIRANRHALKILGANSWVQEGETDISLKNQGRGFLVSELIEAYDRNVPDGIDGLFDIVLSANLEHVPGNILRNYALEGKSPIHLDRSQVEAMGLQPVEATLFSPEYEAKTRVVHHDARRFSLAIRTLLYADRHLKREKGFALNRRASGNASRAKSGGRYKISLKNSSRGSLLCDYLKSAEEALNKMDFRPASLRRFLLDLVWENRDIHPTHLGFFRGAKVISSRNWNRSTDLDNILGYYDPDDGYIKLHENLLDNPSKLREDALVAIGESLLGQYIEKRRWIEQRVSRCYEITLRASAERGCYLADAQLHSYLQLAQMTPDPENSLIFRVAVNDNGGFLPPGLLFGLLYSWYLCGSGLAMEYEMNLLRWPLKSLIPLHMRDRTRKQLLVDFFRTVIFDHRD